MVLELKHPCAKDLHRAFANKSTWEPRPERPQQQLKKMVHQHSAAMESPVGCRVWTAAHSVSWQSPMLQLRMLT